MVVWDDTIKKEFAAFIWVILLGCGVLLFLVLDYFGVHIIWIIFADFVWYAFDVFIAAYMWHVYKLKKADLPKIPGVSAIANEQPTAPEGGPPG